MSRLESMVVSIDQSRCCAQVNAPPYKSHPKLRIVSATQINRILRGTLSLQSFFNKPLITV
jgi:hypothetical protein